MLSSKLDVEHVTTLNNVRKKSITSSLFFESFLERWKRMKIRRSNVEFSETAEQMRFKNGTGADLNGHMHLHW